MDAATEPSVWESREGEPEAGYRPVRIETARGTVDARWYPAGRARRAVVWVGGIGGDWDTPARGLYPDLARELTGEGIASLRVRFRDPTDLGGSVHDLRAGVAFLAKKGVEAVGLVGHSMGGAVVIQAAAAEPQVASVVCLAAQSYGAGAVATLGGRCPVLYIHGQDDPVLPPACSRNLHRLTTGPRDLVLLPHTGHCLDEAADEVRARVRRWLLETLPEG